MADDDPPRPKPRTLRWVVVGVLGVLLLPLAVAFVLVPLLLEQPFESAEEIDPAAVKQLRVFVLNRKELDGGRNGQPRVCFEISIAR